MIFTAMILATIVTALVLFAYNMGKIKGFRKGAVLGGDMELSLIIRALEKLKVQDKYNTIVEDVNAQYKKENEILLDELKRA